MQREKIRIKRRNRDFQEFYIGRAAREQIQQALPSAAATLKHTAAATLVEAVDTVIQAKQVVCFLSWNGQCDGKTRCCAGTWLAFEMGRRSSQRLIGRDLEHG